MRIPTMTTEVPIMKYKLILNNCFHSERTEYEPGEPVKAVFQWLATDTRYQFFIDADDVRQECVNDSMDQPSGYAYCKNKFGIQISCPWLYSLRFW